MNTIESVLQEAVSQLIAAQLPQARLEAEFLIAVLLKKSRGRLLLDRQDSIHKSHLKRVRRALKKRVQRWPLAYLTHDQPFLDLLLTVSPDVLIPRPETEGLVQHVMERIHREKRLVNVGDIGTGSGCIAISLARVPYVERVWAVERSAKALRIAQANARHHQINKKCRWLKGNLAWPLIKAHIKLDYVIANLPYVATKDLRTLEPELAYEPARALDGGPDGLDLIYKLIMQAPQVLKPGGWLVLEIGQGQDHAVRKLLQVGEVWRHIQVHPDLSGIARVVEAQLES